MAHGNPPLLLAAAGVIEAIWARAALASMRVSVVGAARRSSADAEQTACFACLEALQNVAKHARPSAHVTLRLRHRVTADWRSA